MIMNYHYFLRKDLLKGDIICFHLYCDKKQAKVNIAIWNRNNPYNYEYIEVMASCIKRVYGNKESNFSAGEKWPLPWPKQSNFGTEIL